MLTREEQITKLEEAFNTLVIAIAENVAAGYSGEKNQCRAIQLQAVIDALCYIRSRPNPRGAQQIDRPRRHLRLSDDG